MNRSAFDCCHFLNFTNLRLTKETENKREKKTEKNKQTIAISQA